MKNITKRCTISHAMTFHGMIFTSTKVMADAIRNSSAISTLTSSSDAYHQSTSRFSSKCITSRTGSQAEKVLTLGQSSLASNARRRDLVVGGGSQKLKGHCMTLKNRTCALWQPLSLTCFTLSSTKKTRISAHGFCVDFCKCWVRAGTGT